MQLNGSQILIECLKEQGVDTVFGYPGGAILNVYDELYKNCWPGEAESGSVSPGWVVRQESNWYPIQGCVLI